IGRLAPMRSSENSYSALAHILTILPGWGIFFNVILWINFKARSRDVAFHAKQAIAFQAVFLLPVLIVVLMVKLFSRLIALVSEWLGNVVGQINLMFLLLAAVVYVLYCLYGFWRVRTGQKFEYLVAGKLVKSFLSELE